MDLTSLFILNVCILFIILVLFFLYLLNVWCRTKPDEEISGKALDILSEKIEAACNKCQTAACNKCEAGPWYLVVYTKDSNYPIWISNNNIRSVHPGPELCNIVVKQFNGEDMMIENVINYELCSASDLCDYDM